MSKIRTDALQPSRTVLLLVDFVNPLSFEGADELAPSALEAAKQTAKLRRRLANEGGRTVCANDNYGQWTSDFKALWRHCMATPGTAGMISQADGPQAK
jgi:hypothetical protein